MTGGGIGRAISGLLAGVGERLTLDRDARRRRRRARRLEEEVEHWEARGRTPPSPHLVKRRVIGDHAARHGLRTLIETGTFRGDMVAAMLEADRSDTASRSPSDAGPARLFDRIVSIELGEDLAAAASRRFAAEPRVEIVQGDSARRLPEVLARLDGPALLWLDGHWSHGDTARGDEDTPVLGELDAVGAALADVDRSVVLIDDARCFGEIPSYPTQDDLRSKVADVLPGHRFEIDDDIIRVAPGSAAR